MFFKNALLALALCAVSLASPAAYAQKSALLSAVEVNKAVSVVDELHVALTNLMLSDETDLEARKALVSPTLLKVFDLDSMVAAIIGVRQWRQASDAEKEQAEAAFTDWMVTQYASRFTRSSDPKFSTRETRDGGINTIIVETVLRTKKRLVNLDYRMRGEGDAVKVIDVYLDGRVSEVALRKSEYRKTIKDSGIAGFIAALKEKTAAAASAPS